VHLQVADLDQRPRRAVDRRPRHRCGGSARFSHA
jgi:hypothetical protein